MRAAFICDLAGDPQSACFLLPIRLGRRVTTSKNSRGATPNAGQRYAARRAWGPQDLFPVLVGSVTKPFLTRGASPPLPYGATRCLALPLLDADPRVAQSNSGRLPHQSPCRNSGRHPTEDTRCFCTAACTRRTAERPREAALLREDTAVHHCLARYFASTSRTPRGSQNHCC